MLDLVAKLVFWACIFFLVYVEVGYPLLLWLLSRLRSSEPPASDASPTVTFLLAVHNEERVIRAKLQNTLALDYPPDRLQVIVVSDCSTDQTDRVVQEFSGAGVELYRLPERKGKVAALRVAEKYIRGDVVVFSDAASMLEPEALGKLVRHFGNPRVGAVSGHEIRLSSRSSGRGKGEGLYSRIDNLIKELEGQVGDQVLVNGGIFAMRRELMPYVPDHLSHDGIVPLGLTLQGYRTIYEPEAVATEVYDLDSEEDWHRRIRTSLQALQCYLYLKAALNPFRVGFYAVQLWSHRVFRYFLFPVLPVALISNVLLVTCSPLYLLLAAMQIGCYLLAIAGMILDRLGRRPIICYLPFYVLYVHAAVFVGAAMALAGRRIAAWHPTRRGSATQEA